MMGSFDFLFFKQKTAYEMRISDWSSDACSSDLTHNVAAGLVLPGTDHQPTLRIDTAPIGPIHVMLLEATHRMGNSQRVYASIIRLIRSEEHTSELQSLMRNSYAVFCLKKKI